MRLIDADDLIKRLEKFERNIREKNEIRYFTIENIKKILNCSPTSYDVDKVIKQLEKEKQKIYDVIKMIDELKKKNVTNGFQLMIDFQKNIKIVMVILTLVMKFWFIFIMVKTVDIMGVAFLNIIKTLGLIWYMEKNM